MIIENTKHKFWTKSTIIIGILFIILATLNIIYIQIPLQEYNTISCMTNRGYTLANISEYRSYYETIDDVDYKNYYAYCNINGGLNILGIIVTLIPLLILIFRMERLR